MTQRTKQAARKQRAPEPAREVKTLREVPRPPEHCGVAMTRMQRPAVATGELITIWNCNPCGHQMRMPVTKVS